MQNISWVYYLLQLHFIERDTISLILSSSFHSAIINKEEDNSQLKPTTYATTADGR